MTVEVIDANTVQGASFLGYPVTVAGCADIVYRQLTGPTLEAVPWCRVEWDELDPEAEYSVGIYATEQEAQDADPPTYSATVTQNYSVLDTTPGE